MQNQQIRNMQKMYEFYKKKIDKKYEKSRNQKVLTIFLTSFEKGKLNAILFYKNHIYLRYYRA